MTYRGGSLTYDAGDNPTSISLGTGITAGYTSEGVRAWKQAGTVRTYFLYDGTDPVVEMNASGGTVAVNTFGLAGLVSRHYPSMFGANNSVFYTFDETGNVSQRFDGMGTLLSTHGFQAVDRGSCAYGAGVITGQVHGALEGGVGALTALRAIKAAGGLRVLAARGAKSVFTRPRCFVEGTPVAMADGSYKPIEQVKAGDWVQARDEVTGKTESRRVIRTVIHTTFDDTVTVALGRTVGGAVEETITGTPEHPVYVEGRGWTDLGALGVGTEIVTRAGPSLVVQKVTRTAHPEGVKVYNFEVEDYHTYFVGTVNGGLWVHNADCTVPEIEAAEAALGEIGDMWSESGYKSAAESLADHFKGHGEQVKAVDVEQYLRKAVAFSQELKRVRPTSSRGNASTYVKAQKVGSKYIIIENSSKKIISFGTGPRGT